VIEGTPLLWTFEGQKAAIFHLRNPKAEIELAINEPVPPEFQAYVLAAVPPEMLAILQADGFLVFAPTP
jgi:hypothetical protein